MDFAYCKSFIEDFFKKNKDLFFPNGKYSKEDMEKACFDYCQKLCTELEYWEKETQRLGCSDWWMDKEENNEVWQRRLDNIGHEKFSAVCKEAHYHGCLISFQNYTLNKNNFKNPIISIFFPSLGIKKDDTTLKKVSKLIGFWGYWATSPIRCCLSNCEKLLKEIGYFDKNK